MPNSFPPCPQCHAEYTYSDGTHVICPDCGHEWDPAQTLVSEDQGLVVKDAHGNVLQEGDMVTLIKDLKVKGSSSAIKMGTKVKVNRLVDSDHNIDCRVEGFGAMALKSEFVKKLS